MPEPTSAINDSAVKPHSDLSKAQSRRIARAVPEVFSTRFENRLSEQAEEKLTTVSIGSGLVASFSAVGARFASFAASRFKAFEIQPLKRFVPSQSRSLPERSRLRSKRGQPGVLASD